MMPEIRLKNPGWKPEYGYWVCDTCGMAGFGSFDQTSCIGENREQAPRGFFTITGHDCGTAKAGEAIHCRDADGRFCGKAKHVPYVIEGTGGTPIPPTEKGEK